MQQQRAYRYRLELTAEEEAGLYRFAGARRWIWNWALQRKQDHYRQHKAGLSFAALSDNLPRLKADPTTAWLKEVDSQLLQQALRDLEQAFKAFFARRARYPRFKSRKGGASAFGFRSVSPLPMGACMCRRLDRSNCATTARLWAKQKLPRSPVMRQDTSMSR